MRRFGTGFWIGLLLWLFAGLADGGLCRSAAAGDVPAGDVAPVADVMVTKVPGGQPDEQPDGQAGDHPSTVTLVAGEWAPYVSEHMEGNGRIAEVVRRAFAHSGIAVELKFFPWKRCERMLETGEAYGSFPYVVTPVRSGFAEFSDPIFIANSHFFFLKSRMSGFDYTTLQALKGYSIAGALGFNYLEWFAYDNIPVDVSPDEDSMFRKLASGRAQLVPAEERVGWMCLRRLFPDADERFAMSSTPFRSEPNFLMYSKTYPGGKELTALFNAGLRHLRETGELERLLRKTGPETP